MPNEQNKYNSNILYKKNPMSQNQEIKNTHFNIVHKPTKNCKRSKLYREKHQIYEFNREKQCSNRGGGEIDGKMGRKDISVHDKYLREENGNVNDLNGKKAVAVNSRSSSSSWVSSTGCEIPSQ